MKQSFSVLNNKQIFPDLKSHFFFLDTLALENAV